MNTTIYRELNATDVVNLVETHCQAFENFFLTEMGPIFLRAFYTSILKNKDGVGIGCFLNSQLIGFAIGARSHKGFYKTIIKQNWNSLLLAAIIPFVYSPRLLYRLLNALRSNNNAQLAPSPILLSICVKPSQSNKKLGQGLLNEFEQMIRNLGYKNLILTTDKDNNDYVNKFYLKNGFEKISEFSQSRSRTMILYNKNL